jgi:hypothetical protein
LRISLSRSETFMPAVWVSLQLEHGHGVRIPMPQRSTHSASCVPPVTLLWVGTPAQHANNYGPFVAVRKRVIREGLIQALRAGDTAVAVHAPHFSVKTSITSAQEIGRWMYKYLNVSPTLSFSFAKTGIPLSRRSQVLSRPKTKQLKRIRQNWQGSVAAS